MIGLGIRGRSLPSILGVLGGGFIVIVAASVSVWVLLGSGGSNTVPNLADSTAVSDDDRPSVSHDRQAGGGGPPSERLLNLFSSLPVPPRATLQQEPISQGATGDDHLFAFYLVEDEPPAVESFYTAQLPTLGWILESVEPIVSDAKDDGTVVQSTVIVFVKENERLTIGIANREQVPGTPETNLVINIETR